MALSVVVADAHSVVRQGLLRLLGAAGDLQVVQMCVDEPSLRRAIALHRPDVVVTANRLPPGFSEEGITAAQMGRRAHPDMAFVVVSGATNPEYVAALLDGGRSGRAYLLQERLAEAGALVAAVRSVAAGGTVVDAAVELVPGPAGAVPPTAHAKRD